MARPKNSSRFYCTAILILVVAIAVFFRFAWLSNIPPGLFFDEAVNGNDALKALESSHFRIFYPDNNGREGLFINLIALSFKCFGPSVAALRMVSAVIGVLTVLALFLLANRLFGWQVAVISVYLLAVSFWHVNFSRIGFGAITAPLILILAVYYLYGGLQTGRWRDFIASGIFCGLGFHTYFPSRAAPMILFAVLGAYWYRVRRDQIGGQADLFLPLGKRFAVLAASASLVALPLFVSIATTPSLPGLSRLAQVSVFSQHVSHGRPWQTLASQLVDSLGLLVWAGDSEWRHNYSGSPLLLWPVALVFLIGFFHTCAEIRTFRKAPAVTATVPILMLTWFLTMLLPVALSNDGKHALRALNLAPVAFILAGKGAWLLFGWLAGLSGKLGLSQQIGTRVSSTLLAVALLLIGHVEYDKYFHRWAQKPEVAAAFLTHLVEMGENINDLPRSVPIYVVVEAFGVPVDNIPMPAQTVMFITGTATTANQKAKNVFYVVPGDPSNIPPHATVLHIR